LEHFSGYSYGYKYPTYRILTLSEMIFFKKKFNILQWKRKKKKEKEKRKKSNWFVVKIIFDIFDFF